MEYSLLFMFNMNKLLVKTFLILNYVEILFVPAELCALAASVCVCVCPFLHADSMYNE